ncbi:L-rhamnose mutarotase [Pengzhenrongella sp.]|jgi:L-rhamnose mutarotase|uniref:L-rhamnose mutarotase n=1 Tax=Pengzhenrongella sp. TaxID=2888820 RepID=UPI002F922137
MTTTNAPGADRQRVCFQLQVKPGRLTEYRARHAAVWPEMLRALAATGWHNYSLFVRDDGLLIGYLETDDLIRAQAGMAATEVNARWQAEMGDFFVDLDGAPDEGFAQLTEVFNLEDQLAAMDAASTERSGS